MTTSSKISLPWPTSTSDKGPVLKFESKKLELTYDAHGKDKKKHWTTILFNDVIAYCYTQDGSETIEQAEGYNILICKTESPWRSQIIQRWEESYGDHSYQKKMGGSARFKHYNIYFDHHGAVDVIATTLEFK